MMKFLSIVILASGIVSAGCTSMGGQWPPWTYEGKGQISVVWHKSDGEPVMQGDICHVYAQDNDDGLTNLGRQLRLCFDGPVKKLAVPDIEVSEKVVPVIWHPTLVGEI